MHLLQVINVGQIVGGTAACAWTITRAFSEWQHTVVCLGTVHAHTAAVLAPVPLFSWPRVTRAGIRTLRPDVVLFHNTPGPRVEAPLSVPTLQYLHSQIKPAAADQTVYCSHWLQQRYQPDDLRQQVLWQAVPVPPAEDSLSSRALRSHLVVGRICTPTAQKWPDSLPDFYVPFARNFPDIRWEFVGCPAALIPRLQVACQGQAAFHPAGWEQRARLSMWDVLLYHHPTLMESFGRTCAEALRAGCIPVVDRAGGFVEQLTPDSGFLCETADDFSAALAELHSPETRWSRSRHCRAIGDERFGYARFRRDLLTWLQQVAGVEQSAR